VIVIVLPAGAAAGVTAEIKGKTTKENALLGPPPTVTTTLPEVAPAGTGLTMLVPAHVVAVASEPLKLSVLLPCALPKFDPEIVTEFPIAPGLGEIAVTLGEGTTVKLIPLLATPLAFTTTFPVVAPTGTRATTLVAIQLLIVALLPLKVSVPLPCEAPKFVPLTVTEAPAAPEVGDRLDI
jgi:hypothetical protein